jgi:spore coat polysaccharide biosynthesis predicted glycosyltransferase SpsG
MTSAADLRVLFRIAAGPRRGFGHLVRGITLARALGVRPLLCVRGPELVVETALSLGADVVSRADLRTLRSLRPDVVVVDDPVAAAARPWIDAARRAGAVVVTIHDLGIGCTDGDLVIDGSVTIRASRGGAGSVLAGARYAILDPGLRAHRARLERKDDRRVLVALGGGPRRGTARAIAEAIAAADPYAEIRVAGGFDVEGPSTSRSITWLPPTRGLAGELTRTTVAVVGGGVSLYEACAAGVPAVGVPVVRGQKPTVRAFGNRGAVIPMPFRAPERRAAAAVVALLDDPRRRAVLRRRAMKLVDGDGARRATAAVLRFVSRSRS